MNIFKKLNGGTLNKWPFPYTLKGDEDDFYGETFRTDMFEVLFAVREQDGKEVVEEITNSVIDNIRDPNISEKKRMDWENNHKGVNYDYYQIRYQKGGNDKLTEMYYDRKSPNKRWMSQIIDNTRLVEENFIYVLSIHREYEDQGCDELPWISIYDNSHDAYDELREYMGMIKDIKHQISLAGPEDLGPYDMVLGTSEYQDTRRGKIIDTFCIEKKKINQKLVDWNIIKDIK